VRKEECGCEEADDRQANSIRVGKLARNRARVRDIPRDGEAKREAAENS
jgi:hypothetical protein